MNYYERFPGDYGRDTAHLDLAQHGAYTLLLDAQYSTESGLPAPHDHLYRICRAMSDAEQEAVRRVADAYFPVGEDGLRWNRRARKDVAAAQFRIGTSRANGRKGGNPYLEQQYNQPGILYAVNIDPDRVILGITTSMRRRRYGLARRYGHGISVLHAVHVENMGLCEERVLSDFSGRADGQILKMPSSSDLRAKLVSLMDELSCRQPSGVATGLANGQPSSQPSPDSSLYIKDIAREERRTRRAPKRPLPSGFTISDRVKEWAAQKGITMLEERLEHFILAATRHSYVYADWDAAFMTACSDDWARLNGKAAALAETTQQRMKRIMAMQP